MTQRTRRVFAAGLAPWVSIIPLSLLDLCSFRYLLFKPFWNRRVRR